MPSGRYRARYRGADGRRYTAPTLFLTQRDARGWLSLRQAEIIQGEWLPPGASDRPTPDLTFKTYADTWIEQRDLKDRTREHYEKLLSGPHHAHLRVHADRVDHLRRRAGVACQDGRNKTPTLRAHAYGLLRTIMGTAASDGKIQTNPCVIRGGGSARRVHKIRPATLDELAIIVEAMPGNCAP